MGISIGAAKTWETKEKSFIRPKIIEKYTLSNAEMADDIYFSITELTLIEYPFFEPNYGELNFENQRKRTEKVIVEIENLPNSTLKDWMLKQRGHVLLCDYNTIYVAKECEAFQSEYWHLSEFSNINIDCRIISSALDYVRYDCNFNPWDYLISYESILYYQKDNETDHIIRQEIEKDVTLCITALRSISAALTYEEHEHWGISIKEVLETVANHMDNGYKFYYSY